MRRIAVRRTRERVTAVVATATAAAALTALSPAVAGAASWRLEQPDPPPGAQFKVPLGKPGDLKFWSRNRGLLGVEGNSTVPRGLYYWNGVSWRELSSVCGGQGDTMRIAWAGPTEWWTISDPSLPRSGNGTALCHFKDGQVVGSFSTPEEARDPYRQMDAAACNGPNDCWFGGFTGQNTTGEKRGGFHIHWDGQALTTVYAPQGRAVSDISFWNGSFFETTFRGGRPNSETAPDLAQPEADPALVHYIGGGATFGSDGFLPATDRDGTELLAADTNGARFWAVGGGAASGPKTRDDGGPDATAAGNFPRQPLALTYTPGAGGEIALSTQFLDTERFVDVAGVPGADDSAWVAVQRYDQRDATNVKARVALIHADGTVEQNQLLPASGAGRGAAAKIAFTAPDDGWMVTNAGWLFHYTNDDAVAPDTDPAFSGTIDFRPNEAAEQFVPDTPPPDDSGLLTPPPAIPDPPPPDPIQLPALIRGKPKSTLKHNKLTLTFYLRRTAKCQLIARRKAKVVAKSKAVTFKKGKRKLVVKLNPKKWPTKLQFKTKEPGEDSGSGDGDTIETKR
jgi:hypothetical protein